MRAEHRLEAVPLPGAAASVLACGSRFLPPEKVVWDAMPAAGWAQQRSRLLSAGTVGQRGTRSCAGSWRSRVPAAVDRGRCPGSESADKGRGPAHSTMRGYQNVAALFRGQATDRRYGRGGANSGSVRIRCSCSTREHRRASQGRQP
jgi:integrase/recombinase XerC